MTTPGYDYGSPAVGHATATPGPDPTPRPHPSQLGRSRPTPSEAHYQSDHLQPLDEDQVVPQRLMRRDPASIPKLVDETGQFVQNVFERFIDTFEPAPESTGDNAVDAAPTPSAAITTRRLYVSRLHTMERERLSTFYVDWRHVDQYNATLATAITDSYYRFLPFLTAALHQMLARHVPTYFRQHRMPTSTMTATTTRPSQSMAMSGEDDDQPFHNEESDKLFSLAFYNLPLVSRVRSLRTNNIGQLLSISGTVTRTSEVRPELSLATFTCEACRATVPNVEQTFRYTEPMQCPNVTCQNRLAWRLDIRHSTFVDWQKVRIQENSSEIPTGSMPRTMDVILRGEMVDRAKAGEKCVFTGCLIVVPDVSQLGLPGVRPTAVRDSKTESRGADNAGGNGVSGLKALGVRDLTYKLAFLACMVSPDTATAGKLTTTSVKDMVKALTEDVDIDDELTQEKAQEMVLRHMSQADIDDLREIVHSETKYSDLVASFAPTVYGHDIIKKGLLLQLVGGVPKATAEGMALRGDLNICIVGDPSTSKSQFLKYVCSFAPRAVYTSGKASSAAGLTAAVVKDEETGEFTIEAGALMLADNGICAIDEFDKMDIADQVAIHEAMEQQTISIAKAGIQATLNARTSILAAANPVGGRYNRKTTLRANINMSAPIMSRFDLFFVVLDECNEQVDRHLATHIVGIHRLRDDAIVPKYSTEQLQRYVRFCRTFRPVFSEEARELLVQRYRELRADDAQGGVGKNSYRITVRQLESMIRLSEAIAKLNCQETIDPPMVDEACNLLRQSIISVEHDDVEIDDEDEDVLGAGVGSNGIHAEDVDMGGVHAATGGANGHDPAALTPAPAPAPAAGTTGASGAAHTSTDGAGSGRPQHFITHDKWSSMVNTLAHKVNSAEQETGEGVEREELIEWYLSQVEDDMTSEEEYNAELELVKKVLKKMVKSSLLMAICGEGLQDGGAPSQSSAAAERVVYVLHPNCSLEAIG